MKTRVTRSIRRTLIAASMLTLPVMVGVGPVPAQAAPDAPRVEVVFVLDTTGSMSGLIEGAKQKIWWIANQVVKGTPTPEVSVGLVGYRDVSDAYVTRVHDLDADLDAVYRDLREFEAGGGGDTPEHVNRALHEAVYTMSWSDDDRTLKLIFLVGDAPPHVDYADGLDYHTICREAVTRDIIVNTVQCGLMPETTSYWTEIARLGEGKYAAVEQSGGMRQVDTPMDEELASLGRELDGTVVFYGDRSVRNERKAALMVMSALPEAPAAERASYEAASGGRGSGDLVRAFRDGTVALDAIDEDELPEDLAALAPEERERVLAERAERQSELESRITELSRQRDAYVQAALAEAGGEGSFDGKLLQMLKAQAARKDIRY